MDVIKWDGNPISKAGIYSHIPMLAYHQQLTVGPSISSSGLRTIESKTPRHYFEDSYLNPGDPEDQEDEEEAKMSKAFIFGRAVHHLFGGEKDFYRNFAVRPVNYPNDNTKKWNANSNDCKAWLAERALEGRDVLSPAEMVHIRRMARALAETEEAQAGMLYGLVEHSIIWQDQITGVWLKARPDVIPQDSAMVVDIKTTTDASWEACSRAVTDHGYHMQLALVDMGMRATANEPLTDYFLAWLEKGKPYCAAVRPIDNIDIDYGRRQLRRAIDDFARCLETGVWHGYEDTSRPVTLTGWVRKRLNDEAENKTLPPADGWPAHEARRAASVAGDHLA